jgi:hypothetical protein
MFQGTYFTLLVFSRGLSQIKLTRKTTAACFLSGANCHVKSFVYTLPLCGVTEHKLLMVARTSDAENNNMATGADPSAVCAWHEPHRAKNKES